MSNNLEMNIKDEALQLSFVKSCLLKLLQKRILVHFHLFYHNQVDYFIKKLSNINSCKWDLYVTYVEENKEAFDKIKKLKPSAKFIKVENRGYDVWPFIQLVKSIDIEKYDCILKIHTKNSRTNNIYGNYEFAWRDTLVDALIGSKKRFFKNLYNLNYGKGAGMICSSISYGSASSNFPEDNDMLQDELKRINFKTKEGMFCSGTMFIVKSSIMNFLKQDIVKKELFAYSKNTGDIASLAHVYERILCFAVNEFGYKILPVKYLQNIKIKQKRNFLEYIFSVKNEEQPGKKYKVITIFGLKIKIKTSGAVSKDAVVISERYWKRKPVRPKNVVYTCITNNYDNIEAIKAYKYTDPEFDYICFTDNAEQVKQGRIGIWQIRPLVFDKLDDTRNNRWHKVHPHILFPEYERSVYIDANINILTSKYFNLVKKTQKDIIIPRHNERNCIYDEKNEVIKLKFDSAEIIDKQFEIIKNAGFPENFGMFENNLIYRKHNNPEIIEMMEEWWYFIESYSKRDQLSLMYIFWKRNRNPKDYQIENTRVDFDNFCCLPHQKGPVLCKS